MLQEIHLSGLLFYSINSVSPISTDFSLNLIWFNIFIVLVSVQFPLGSENFSDSDVDP